MKYKYSQMIKNLRLKNQKVNKQVYFDKIYALKFIKNNVFIEIKKFN